MKKENLIVGLLVVSILVSAVCLYGVFGRAPKGFEGKTINVTGVAKVDVKPDTAYITLGVSTTDVTVKSALDKNSASVSKITDAVKKLGVKDEVIQTSNFSVYPQYNDKSEYPKQTGYTVANDITVKTTPDKVSQVILAGATNGANNFYNFVVKVSNEEEVKTTLMANAIDDAKKKAEALASASNKKLGDFKMISYDFVPETQYYSYNGMGGAEGYAPVQAGQNEIKVTVYVIFEVN